MIRRPLLVAALLLVPAPGAWAHASLVRASPGNGDVLAQAPRAAVFGFDSTVHVGSRNAAIANDGGGSVLRGKARIVGGRTLVVPLQAGLRDGNYTVRWNAVSEDGHPEEGVIAFAVGAGRAPPVAALSVRGIVTWQRVVMRTLFFLGILGAAGVSFFALAVLRPLGVEGELLKPEATLLFVSLLLAFLGSDALIHVTSAGGTRFATIVQVAATVAAVGGAAAALAPIYPWLRYVAWGASGLLFLAPTIAGHALDGDQPAVLAALVDLVHLGAAAVWLGGLAALAFVAARADDAVRLRAARRFSAIAFAAVAVVALSGIGRALTELGSVSQIWTTDYGRTLIAKTALFVPLLGLGWLNRTALLTVFSRLRRSVLVELTILTGVVVAVGVLTDVRPGVAAPAVSVASQPAPARKPPLPPPGTFVAGGRAGSLAVGVSVGHAEELVTVLRPDGTGANGLRVIVDGLAARPCGDGCYMSAATTTPTEIRLAGHRLVFVVPIRLRDGSALLRRATGAYRSLRTVSYVESLASGPGPAQVSDFRLRAPHSLAYRIRGGPEGIVIGARRWDRPSAGEAWTPSAQTPLRVPSTLWSGAARNAFFSGPAEITFLDPRLPGWFRLRVDPRTSRPLELRMTAAGHFMVERYSGFDRAVEISPPLSR